jgi:hypothetical protein
MSGIKGIHLPGDPGRAVLLVYVFARMWMLVFSVF